MELIPPFNFFKGAFSGECGHFGSGICTEASREKNLAQKLH